MHYKLLLFKLKVSNVDVEIDMHFISVVSTELANKNLIRALTKRMQQFSHSLVKIYLQKRKANEELLV